MVLLISSCSIPSSLQISTIQCNGKAEPLNVGTQEPSFSWQLSSSQHNQYQSAWQIVLASSPQNLEDGDYIWDSGKQLEQKNTRIQYQGPELESAQSYYWRVKVWDEEGNPTDWSPTAKFVTALAEEQDWQGASWIGYETMTDSMKVVPGVPGSGDDLGEKGKRRPVIPQFRKEFTVDKPVAEAFLFISGLGHYEADLNGQKIGDRFLSPGWAHYEETVLYNTYDLTNQLKQGANALGVTVGNGFYNVNRERYNKLVVAYGMPKMLSVLKIVYEDDSVEHVISGPDWQTAKSPTTYTSIYGGENYDARLEQPRWNAPDFTEDTNWKQALDVDPPAGELKGQTSHPVKAMDTLEVKRILEPKPGTYVYDFGQNASGIMKLEVSGQEGQKVTMRPAELLTNEGFANQEATGEPHYYTYTLKGDDTETWQPKFTYYGFRYIQVEGAAPDTVQESSAATISDLDFLHTRNSAPQTGGFETFHELFNRIYDLINWAVKSNYQHVLTDCPHREKLGWLEQTHLMGGSVHYNFHLHHLYKKLVHDMMDAQTKSGMVPNIAPEYVVFPWELGFRDSPEWGSASVILPWLLYKWYGDTQVMEQAWPMMTEYVDYLENRAEEHIVSHGLGDWYDLGPERPGFTQLTPVPLTATATYYYDVKLLSRMAEIIGKTEQADQYAERADQIYTAFNEEFYNEETGIYATGSQTSMAIPLAIGLVDSLDRRQVFSNLADSIRANDKALTAGDVGFNYLVKALEQNGASQLLFEMNNRTDVPGYGYQLEKGATALTESWMALENSSNNHLMLGHIMEWFYGGLAGIQQAEDSHAYSHILIDPDMVQDIEWTRAWYDSPNGRIESDWSLEGETGSLDVTIPVNATATVVIPSAGVGGITESGQPVNGHQDILEVTAQDSTTHIEIGSGDWSFEFPKK